MTQRILAIDDSESNLALIAAHLANTEFELVTATSGAAALDCLRREDFDLILLDAVMPDMDGFEVCSRLQATPRTRRIPVIFMTGRLQTEPLKLRAFELGAVDYLEKPVHGEELLARIRATLRLRDENVRLERENLDLVQHVHRVQSDAEALREEVLDLHELAFDRERSRPMFVRIDGHGAILEQDVRFSGFLREIGISRGDVPRLEAAESEVWVGFGDRRRCLAIHPVDLASESGGLLALSDVTTVHELRATMSDRKPQIVDERPAAADYRIGSFIGVSEAALEIARTVDRLRNLRTTVLIYGESGTGKELIARALHFDGRFRDTPFIPIHCGAISPHLIESELFGHQKGAFTGAETASTGLLAAADRGTVFLDEIAETPVDLQIKLLRVLQLGEVRAVGSTQSRQVDVRFIAATNDDLAARVRRGEFREDLFHRLNVVTIRVPPLRERREDILPLAQHLLRKYGERHGRRGRLSISQGAARLLGAYPWPGNVRELENVLDAALSLGCGDVLRAADLPATVREGRPPRLSAGPPRPARDPAAREIPRAREHREHAEADAIREALARFGGDKRRAMEYLGMPRSTFYRKLKDVR